MELFRQEKRDWALPGKVGTCSQMCPQGEIAERRKYNQLHVLERNPFDENDSSLMIKKYYRSQTEETRQNNYLRDRLGIALSMDRLRKVMNQEDVPFETRASFIWDRYRAIWKDMSIQNWQDIFRVSILEEMVRFLILADFKIAFEESQVSRLSYQDAYDAELGIQLLLQCFVTLSELYETMRNQQQTCPNEMEFRIYHALLQITPVEGREMEHEEIDILFKSFPEELLNENISAFERLQYLYETMKSEKWDEIIDLIWQMEFFEFALGRRILERFREIRFKKFFRRLRYRSTLTTHPPMPLHEFCDRFFLDKNGAREFATAYGMQIETDNEGQEYIIIHEGISRPKAKAIPKIGAGIVSWGFLDGKISISDFVCQHPSQEQNAYFNFAYTELLWPSYQQALQEWSFLSQLYNISEYGAALLHANYWHKYNRAESLHEVPVIREYDEEGNEIKLPYPLPFFRTVDDAKPMVQSEKAEEEEMMMEPEDEVFEEDVIEDAKVEEEEEGNKEVAPSQSFFGGIEGHNEAFWVPSNQLFPLKSAPVEVTSTSAGLPIQIESQECSIEAPLDISSAQQIEHDHAIREEEESAESLEEVGTVYTHSMFLNKQEFDQLVKRGRLQCRKKQMKSVGVQYQEEDPLPLPLLTPVETTESELLPHNAKELFMEHCDRKFGLRPKSQSLPPEERQKFNKKLIERYQKILKIEESLPDGWRIRPKRKRELMRIENPWRDPDLVPRTYPPQLTEAHVLEEMQMHALVQKPMINQDLAAVILNGKSTVEDHFCHLVLLRNGKPKTQDFLHNWLACRVFGDTTSTHISESVRFTDTETSLLHYNVYSVDMNEVSDKNIVRIQNASAFLLFLDDQNTFEDSFIQLQDVLSSFSNERKQCPPVVVLDGRKMQSLLIHEDSILEEEDGLPESELYSAIGKYFDCASVDIFVVALSHHLGLLTRTIFREMCEKWRSDLCINYNPKPEMMIKEDGEMDRYDPIDHAIRCIKDSIQFLEGSAFEYEADKIDEVDLDVLSQNWEKEWAKMRNYGKLFDITDGEEIYWMEHRKQTYLKLKSKKPKKNKKRKESTHREGSPQEVHCKRVHTDS